MEIAPGAEGGKVRASARGTALLRRDMDTIPPPEVCFTASTRAQCDGDEGGGPNGHPLVYLQMGTSGYADCGYCDRRFVLTGGPADPR